MSENPYETPKNTPSRAWPRPLVILAFAGALRVAEGLVLEAAHARGGIRVWPPSLDLLGALVGATGVASGALRWLARPTPGEAALAAAWITAGGAIGVVVGQRAGRVRTLPR